MALRYHIHKKGNKMGESEFIKLCKNLVVQYVNQSDYVTKDGHRPYIKNCHVFVVWLCKILQNNKALLSTTIVGDTRYYEITYNGTTQEIYFDAYDKLQNVCIDKEMWKKEKKIEW